MMIDTALFGLVCIMFAVLLRGRHMTTPRNECPQLRNFLLLNIGLSATLSTMFSHIADYSQSPFHQTMSGVFLLLASLEVISAAILEGTSYADQPIKLLYIAGKVLLPCTYHTLDLLWPVLYPTSTPWYTALGEATSPLFTSLSNKLWP